jgi:hypothetical protein
LTHCASIRGFHEISSIPEKRHAENAGFVPDQLRGVSAVPEEAYSKETVRAFVVRWRESGVSPICTNTYRRVMNAYVRWLHEEGHTDTPPARDFVGHSIGNIPMAKCSEEEIKNCRTGLCVE